MHSLQVVGLWPRLQAFLLDYLIILIYVGLLIGVALAIKPIQSLYQNPVQADVFAVLTLILPVENPSMPFVVLPEKEP